MKTFRTNFKRAWFPVAVAIIVTLGEIGAWVVTRTLGLTNDPLKVGLAAVALVAAMASILYDGEDIG